MKEALQANDFWNYVGVDFERSEFYTPLSPNPPAPPANATAVETQALLVFY